MKYYIVFLITICVFLFPLSGAEVEFSASVDAETVGLDDYVIYTITFKGIQNPVSPDISSIGDFNVIQTSRSSEFKFINGESSSFINYIYYLSPLKEGTLIIPPVKYIYKGKLYKTEMFKIIAVKGSIRKVSPRKRRRSIFDLDEGMSPFESSRSVPTEIDVKLKALVSKKKLLIGEQIIYKVLLYSRNRIESVNLISGQSFPGFWQEWYPVKRSIDGSREVIDGKEYQVYEIRKAALFPSETGELQIPSVRFELSLSDNSFSFFSAPKKISRSTNNIKIKVENIPGNNGSFPVGNMKLTVTSLKSELNINELLSIIVRVKGFGNIKTVKIPEFVSGDDFDVFPSKITRKTDYKESGIFGVITAEVPVSFKRAGHVTIPSLEIKYFDPVAYKVKISRSKEFVINVTGVREERSDAENIISGGVSKRGSDIDFIIKGRIWEQKRFFYQSLLFRIILLLIIMLVIFVFLYEYVIKVHILGNKNYLKKKSVSNLLGRLDNIKDYGEVFQIIEEYIEEKTGIPRSEINNIRIENIFSSSGIGKRDIETFLRIRTESELSRFSRSTIKTLSQIKDEISGLKNLIKKIDSKLK